MTKCNNCRAWVRYRNDRVYEDTGRIEKVTEEGGEVWMRFVADEDGELIVMWENGKICEHIMDFEIVPRDPETYKDWQVGDKVCEDEHRNACYEVIFRSGELVVFKDWNNWASNPMTCSEAFTRFGMRLVLTDIERQIIEERKKSEWKPQDGDIVAWKDRDDDNPYAISIYKGKERCYATVFANSDTMYSPYATFGMNIIRPATEEEKQKLFNAMAKEGKRWNAEKKCVENIPKSHEFRKGEPVLVRIADDGTWKLRSFVEHDASRKFPYVATEGIFEDNYAFCLPYNERTMHLLGTKDDYREE